MSDKEKTVGHDIVDLALEGKGHQLEKAFDLEVSSRLSGRLDQKRTEVAAGIFASPLETED